MEPYYRLAEELNLPIVCHSDELRERDSIHIYNAAKSHPKINFVIVHMDLGTNHQNAIEYISRLDNLYGDTTWVINNNCLIEAIKKCGSEKILFGSDNPVAEELGRDTYVLYKEIIFKIRNLIKIEDYENIMYKNSKKLFKINFELE